VLVVACPLPLPPIATIGSTFLPVALLKVYMARCGAKGVKQHGSAPPIAQSGWFADLRIP
jgi:hypothetical protein